MQDYIIKVEDKKQRNKVIQDLVALGYDINSESTLKEYFASGIAGYVVTENETIYNSNGSMYQKNTHLTPKELSGLVQQDTPDYYIHATSKAQREKIIKALVELGFKTIGSISSYEYSGSMIVVTENGRICLSDCWNTGGSKVKKLTPQELFDMVYLSQTQKCADNQEQFNLKHEEVIPTYYFKSTNRFQRFSAIKRFVKKGFKMRVNMDTYLNYDARALPYIKTGVDGYIYASDIQSLAKKVSLDEINGIPPFDWGTTEVEPSNTNESAPNNVIIPKSVSYLIEYMDSSGPMADIISAPFEETDIAIGVYSFLVGEKAIFLKENIIKITERN